MTHFTVPTRIYRHPIVEMNPTDRFTANGMDYIPLRVEKDGYVVRHETDGQVAFMSHAEIHRSLSEKRASICYGYNSVSEQKLRLVWGDEGFEDLNPEKRSLPIFREKLILRYEEECLKAGKELPRSAAKLQPLLDKWAHEINSGPHGPRRKRGDQATTSFNAPSVRQFNRDYAKYMECGRPGPVRIKKHATGNGDHVRFT